MNKKKFRFWLILSLLWLVVIFGHSAMPADLSRQESLGIFAWLQDLFPWLTHGLLRKLGHFAEFSILGLFLTGAFWHRGRFQFYKPLGSALFIALCDETLQLFIPGRSGEIWDVWIDFSGALCGSLFLWLIFRLKKK